MLTSKLIKDRGKQWLMETIITYTS